MLTERLKHYVYNAWTLVARYVAEKERWSKLQRLGNQNPLVYYGHDCIPSRNERSGGAIIKLQDLEEIFPNVITGANILYLVNSGLPNYPEIMVKEAKRHGAIFVLNQNGVAYPAWHGPGWEKTNRPMLFLMQEADYVIYQSEFCKVAADRFLAPCQVPWTILHNPVDTKVFSPTKGAQSGLRLLMAGSHQHLYRVRTALETLKLILEDIHEASLTIAGRYTWRKSETDCLKEARGLAEELGVSKRVEFSGGYTQAEAPSLFNYHNILLHTQYNDCCPRLVVEAMACGLPIVYSKSGGLPELVGDEAGVGVQSMLDWENEYPPDPSELGKATLQVFSSLDRYAKSARRRAERCFDVKSWQEKHSVIFRELIQKKSY